MIVYLNGRYLTKEGASISVDDRGFLFADGVYEVVRCYRGHLFQFQAHLQRMEHGLSALRIAFHNLHELVEVSRRLLKDNNLVNDDAVVYLQITRGAAWPRTHAFPEADTLPTVYVAASSFAPPLQKREQGIAVITTPDLRWSRCDLKTVGLLVNCLGKQQALELGADEVIFVRDGVALEGSSSSLFIVKHGIVRTNPKTNYILPGITRQVVIDLCWQQRIAVEEMPVFVEALQGADEVFITHTTGEIVPVVRVDQRAIAAGTPGQMTRRLQSAFNDFVASSTTVEVGEE